MSIFSSPFWRGFEAEGGGTYYRPVTVLTYALDHALFGFEPWGYHLTNVLLHALTSLLVFLLARRVIRSDRAALAAGAMFAVHPVLTEAVASVSGRSDILVTFFALAAIGLHISRRKHLRQLAWIAVFFAVCSKEIGIVVPILLMLADCLWPRDTADHGTVRLFVVLRGNLANLVSLISVIALRWYAVGNLSTVTPSPLDNPLVEHGIGTALLTLPVVLLEYLRLLVFPVSLSVDYGFSQLPVQTQFSWHLFAIAMIAVFAFVYRSRFSSPTTIFAGCLLALPVLAVSNPFLSAGSILSERYLYLPSVGLVILAAAACHRYRPSWLNDLGRRQAAWCILLVLLSAGTARTIHRNVDWATDESLFASAVGETPNSVRANLNYAEVLSSRGDHLTAAKHYEHVLRS